MAKRKWLKALAFGAVVLGTGSARATSWASDYRWGLLAGYGGGGISTTLKDPEDDAKTFKAQKAEGPFVGGVFIEHLLSDSFLLGFEHIRGISIVPFSAGASFTGLSFRWYFFGPAPSMVKAAEGSTLQVSRWTPFLGLAGGVALVDIYRDDKKIPHISGSGTYFGIRMGADYLLGPGYGIRPELITAATTYTASFSNAVAPPDINLFSIGCSWFYNF